MSERDREIEVAWRAASREDPPAALDAAIRAQARRAVGARPHHRQGRGYWRYPAAAAATVALLAFGIAQMTSRDQIEPVIVADQTTAPRNGPALGSSLGEHAGEIAGASESSAAAKPARVPEAAADAKRAATPPVASAPIPAPPTPSRKTARQEAPSGQFAAPPPPAQSSINERPASGDESRRDRPPTASAQAPAPVQPAAPGPATDALQRRSVTAAPLAAANDVSVDEIKAKQAGVESLAVWIARIRTLRSTGQLDAAAKEIEKFRSAYGDRADQLLPSDLRGSEVSDSKGH